MRFKYVCRLLFITLFLAGWMLNAAYASDSINWYSYEEGKVLAKIEKKKVFLHFYADWCVFCMKMAKEAFQDTAVISNLNKNFIAIRVDFDKDMATAEKYGVNGLPATWFLTEMGQPILSAPGYLSTERLLSLLDEVKQAKAGG